MGKITTWTGWGKVGDAEKKHVLRNPNPVPAAETRDPSLQPPLAVPASRPDQPGSPRVFKSVPTKAPPKAPPAPTYPAAFAGSKTPRIDPREQDREKWKVVTGAMADAAPAPKPCSMCGQDLGDSQFVLYTPHRSPICRSCRQSARRCPHCLEAHPPGGRGRDEACDDCRGRTCTSCNARIEGPVFRMERHKGVYCEACFGKGARCDFCGLPAQTPHPTLEATVCRFCEPTGLATHEAAMERLDLIQRWLSKVHPLLARPDVPLFPERPTPPIKAIPFQAEGDSIHLGPQVPQVCFDRTALEFLITPFIRQLTRVVPESPLEADVRRLFRMAWHDRDGHWVLAEDEKRRGLRAGTQFAPLYQVWEKVGMSKAVVHLCRTLGGPL